MSEIKAQQDIYRAISGAAEKTSESLQAIAEELQTALETVTKSGYEENEVALISHVQDSLKEVRRELLSTRSEILAMLQRVTQLQKFAMVQAQGDVSTLKENASGDNLAILQAVYRQQVANLENIIRLNASFLQVNKEFKSRFQSHVIVSPNKLNLSQTDQADRKAQSVEMEKSLRSFSAKVQELKKAVKKTHKEVDEQERKFGLKR